MKNLVDQAQTTFERGLDRVPEALRQQVRMYWQDFKPFLPDMLTKDVVDNDWLQSLPKVWACSDFIARSCLQHPQILQELIGSGDLFREYTPASLTDRVAHHLSNIPDEAGLRKALRILRRREMLRTAWRDLAGWADLNEVMATLSELADACIDQALTWLHRSTVKTDGEPIGEHSGNPVTLVVLALGKLGGGELNFSSDVDLIFAYPEEGETVGPRSVSNHEFFIRLAQKLISVLSDVDEEGFVFRVDMRLRPNGKSGPLVLSFDAMEHYYQTHGRDWERYAFIKARAAAGDRAAGEELLTRLRPFVYRKYLDYGAVEAIRALKLMIDSELQRKGIQNNIKLGPGGIREIEFIGQAWQLIRGGREIELQQREILKVLALLDTKRMLTDQAVTNLIAGYKFLRTTEHRLQMIADQQVHELPSEDLGRLRLAVGMGFGDWTSFATMLRQIMRRVHEYFSQMFTAPQREPGAQEENNLSAVWLNTLDLEAAHSVLVQAGYSEPNEVLSLLQGLREGRAYVAFSSTERNRMDQLMPLLLGAAGLSPQPQVTLARIVKLLEAIGRRSVYLALLIENPLVLSQLVKLTAASPWIANWISTHPILLDELLSPMSLYRQLSREDLAAELEQGLARIPAEDLETRMEILREFRHGHVLRVAAADIGPGMAPENVGECLSLVAGVILERSMLIAQQVLISKHGCPTCRQGNKSSRPGFAVIGYGKLGSLELGYASDLDMIFLYQGCDEDGVTNGERSVANEVFFARLGQRLLHILSARTPTGQLYEVDMRLRPSGRSGPLVTSLDAFRLYQQEHAWTWEHQALVRARAVAGDPEVCRGFAEVRRKILCRQRDPERLCQDIRDMREKMRAAQPGHASGLFDVKHDRGGIVDIEFMVQYWVLRWAADFPELARNTDNIHILKALAGAGLLVPEQVQLFTDAYRRYLSTEHRLKLMERGSLAARAELDEFPDRIAVAWNEVFT